MLANNWLEVFADRVDYWDSKPYTGRVGEDDQGGYSVHDMIYNFQGDL